MDHDHGLRPLLTDGGAAPTRDAGPAVREPLRSLLSVLADPETSAVSFDLADDVADIVSDLIDTRPPLPPLSYPDRGAQDDEHALSLIHSAIAGLENAVASSSGGDAHEKLRAALAARRLADVLARWRP